MVLEEKIVILLKNSLDAEYVHLDADDGISGFVVSRKFEKVSTIDRQLIIEEALQKTADALSEKEQRRILMIAGITPLEYESVGAPIRVHRIRKLGDGSLEVLLRGGYSDALYVRGVLNSRKGVKTTEPKESPGAEGIFMFFVVKGTKKNRLSKHQAIKMLESDQYIQMMHGST